MGIYQEKHVLYQEYAKELDEFRHNPIHVTEEEVWQWCEAYIEDKECSWKNIFSKTGELAGFLIIGKGGVEKHPDSDYGIAQAFVAAKYRKQGLMTAAISDYIQRHVGTYSLLVLKNNKHAIEFWNKVFLDGNYKKVDLNAKYVNSNGDDLVLLGFSR